MSDLPQDTPVPNSTNDSTIASPPSITVGGKEGEVIGIAPQELPLTPVGQEIDLPKEVVSAGVTITPQSVNLPPPVVQAGLSATGAHAPVHAVQKPPAHLPLTDEQIAKALHQSVTSSVRWLAEWCVRQMKLMHKVVKGTKE